MGNFMIETTEQAVAVSMKHNSEIPMLTLIDTIKADLNSAEHHKAKSAQFYISAGLNLKEAKQRNTEDPDGISWAEFVKQHFPLKRSRADELIRIADGKTTMEKVQQGNKKRVQKARAKALPLRNGRSGNAAAEPHKKNGSQVAVPSGYSKLSEAIKAAVALERGGMKKTDALKQIKLSVSSYDAGRDIVLLSELELPAKDATTVQTALTALDANLYGIVKLYKPIKPIAQQVWGNKGNRFKADKRTEAFCNSVFYVLTGCTGISNREIPHLDKAQRNEVIHNLNEGISALRKLATRLNGGNAT